jgi:hypothetical protein
MDYLTVQEIRDEYGERIAEETDRALTRRLDRLSATLEDQLGHAFGRAIVVTSTAADTVQVTATSLVIGGHTFLFATYATLAALVDAANALADTFSLAILPQMAPETPSTLLKVAGAQPCGPAYENRVVLDISALWLKLSGKRESHLFLPLPLGSVSEVIEDAVTLAATDYWAMPGELWLIRKLCSCSTTTCRHPTGRWPDTYPGNITVSYAPRGWNTAPGAIKSALLEAIGSSLNLTGLQGESFGDYSWRRGTVRVDTWQELLGGSAIRPYVVRFQP